MRSARSKCGAMWASRPTGMPLRRGRRPRRPAQNHLRFAPVFSEYDRTLYGAMPTSRRTAQAEICSIPRRTRAGFPLCFVGADALGGPLSDDCQQKRAIRESPLRILFRRVSFVRVGVLDDPRRANQYALFFRRIRTALHLLSS